MLMPSEWVGLWNQLTGEERVFVGFLSAFGGIIILLQVFLIRCRTKSKELERRYAELAKTFTSDDSQSRCQQKRQK